jgi:glycosyltransferase involved in cell wall biosynthesis
MTGAGEPQVSVVIPSYDTAEHARGAVASVQAQTLRDFEIVLVDDGSRRENAAILDELAAQPAVRLLRQAHAGPDRARRRGWEEARGALVAFLDDDDRHHPDYLEACVARLEADPQLGAVYCRYQAVGPDGTPRGVLPKQSYQGRIFAREVAKSTVKTSTLIVRREHLRGLTGLTERTRSGGNYDLVLRLAYHIRFGFEDRVLVTVTQRPGSFSKDLSRRHLDRSEILENLLRAYPEMPPLERRSVEAKIGKYLLKAGLRSARQGRRAEARALLRRSLSHRPSPRALWQYARMTVYGAG